MWRSIFDQMKIRASLRQFLHNTAGVSAVEFALILPVMLTLLFGSVEVANILIADRKTANIASAAADLVAQAITVNDADMANIFFAADAIMQPFDPAFVTIVIASVTADAGGVTRVAWSDARNGTPYAPGTAYTLPPGLVGPNQSVIVAEVRYEYHSDLGELITGAVMLNDRFFLAPRRSISVTRTAG